MKMFWVALGIIVVIVASAVGLYTYSLQLHHQLHGELEQLELAAKAENWEEARRIANRLDQTWARADTTWSPVMDHRDVDRVDEAIARVNHLSVNHQKDDLLLEISVARRFITRLMQKETLSFRSVF